MARLRGHERARYVSRLFGRIARRYDLLNTIMSGGRHYAWRRIAARAATEPALRGAALDVACGTGDFALELARNPAIDRVVGIDFVEQMLLLARAKAARRPPPARAHFLAADAHALPFPDHAFVCATVGFGVRNFIDVPLALREMARVVRPGGRVVILEIVRMERRNLRSRLLPKLFRATAPLLGKLLAGDAEAYAYLPESVDEFLSAPQLADQMRRAGLRKIQTRPLALGSVAILSAEVPPDLISHD